MGISSRVHRRVSGVTREEDKDTDVHKERHEGTDAGVETYLAAS